MSLFFETSKSYEDLTELYGGFQAPVVKIASGSNIFTLILSALTSGTALGIQADNVTVTLNKNSASSASLSIVNTYSPLLRTFQDKVTVGAKIIIFMGYGSVTPTVFAGYVDTVSYEYTDAPTIKITAFDAVKLMMSRGPRKRTWKNGGFYTADYLEIMSDYSEACSANVTNMLPTLKTHGTLVQNTDDYDYIKNTLCKFCDRDFVIAGGKAYFYSPYLPINRTVELGVGKGIKNFSVSPSYKKVKVIVTGDRIKGLRAESKVSTGASYTSAMEKPQEIIKENMPFMTEAECKLYADRLAFDEISEARTAGGSCVGIPDLIPGRVIGVSGIDLRWDNYNFILDTVTHTMSSGGYTTSFTTKGW